MANVREELISVVNTLNHIIDTDLDTKPKGEGRVVYFVNTAYDGICVYTDKDDIIVAMMDLGDIDDFSTWYEDLSREDIEDICKNKDCSFRQALDEGYKEYCVNILDNLLVDLDGTDFSIKLAHTSKYIKVHLI